MLEKNENELSIMHTDGFLLKGEGSKMEYKIQNIIFPIETKHQDCKGLFYHGDGCLDREEKALHLGKGQNVDFTTYLNGCSSRKWKKYTKAKGFSLYLDVQGVLQICLTGYTKDVQINRTEDQIKKYYLDSRQVIHLQFSDNEEQIIGFEISAIEDSVIYGGYYTVETDESELNEVRLCLATTTYKKEKFIKKNLECLRQEIINSEFEIRDNLYIHVVDNGRTLSSKDVCGEHIYLHPNSNSGGSGGYARGMIESLNQTPKATHVLLMDDDVLVLPESVFRTFRLLRLMKEEYKTHFISGAMLYYEEPNRQHEDIGTVTKDAVYETLKPRFDHNYLEANLDNEADFAEKNSQYAAWWYCCIPAEVIEKNGLPLPLFIRWDDSEYSSRCKAKFITMNGICIWHMGFTKKYNSVLDLYQQCRNFLIGRASSNVFQDTDPYNRIFKAFRVEMLKFNYDGAELVLRAFQDFLKGPEFLKANRGEEIIKRNSKLNEKLIPLNQVEGCDIQDVWSCFSDPPRKFLDKWLFRLTYNGQRFWPTALCKKDVAYISFDYAYQPQKMSMHNKLIAINPFDNTGNIRKLDKVRYRKLSGRFKQATAYYEKHKEEIEAAYRDAMPYLTSEKFWREYLEI